MFRIEWAAYKTLMIHPGVNAFGHVDATEMYDALLSANRNGTTEIQAKTYNNEGVCLREGPYIQEHQNATESSSSHKGAASQSGTSRTTSTQRTLPKPHRIVVWATIRRLAIYHRNGAWGEMEQELGKS